MTPQNPEDIHRKEACLNYGLLLNDLLTITKLNFYKIEKISEKGIK